MTHLLSISIGPVQDFIAAARRTADLYAGSQILQELSRVVARYLAEQNAGLIFPSDQEADGANKILAEVTDDPQQLAEGARKAAQEKLKQLWQEAMDGLPERYRKQIDQGRAQLQLESFLEFYAAWVPLENNYPQARQSVERLLAGRKALREFAPTQQNDEGIPKSPLDPSRAAVIDPRMWGEATLRLPDGAHRPLRIKPTEHLDAISLLKRCYGVSMYQTVVDTRTMARRAQNPKVQPEDRWGEDDDHITEPQPYFAILVADGDRMGELISRQDNPEAHRALSKTLDDFAHEAQRIVGKHHGFMVYSGGDDVLAFLPVNRAIACGQELSESFRHRVRGTLSAGIAVVHYREPLSQSLQWARDAEKAAKDGGRNALAVALHTRGGAPITVVRPWDRLRWRELLQSFEQGDLTQGLAYELLELAREWQDDMNVAYLQAEAERILGRKERKGLKLPLFESRQDLLDYAKELVVARFLSGVKTENQTEVGRA
ncbi:type III-B CRISPR-associated protein Cas10/Cmr2 [Meiothermus ruber]|uniref:type III-B CRISPR-associated protein Cas10/Cmr2 n=1 Tax=Meiothermus ruber TaxID=277 RepID=UPI0003486787|nr:type III-B CRISPR-associated protein Cas10/Cmr2 [Meiothermus ruber]GAO75189.1 Cmr2 family CRISPR-associated protein [Meiothermus ruber H328]